MTPKEFYDNVVNMRKFQREYFRSNGRDRVALQSAKHYEQMIDVEIKRVELMIKEQRSPRLDFDGNNW